MNMRKLFTVLLSMIAVNVSAAQLICQNYTITVTGTDPWGGTYKYYTTGTSCYIDTNFGGGGGGIPGEGDGIPGEGGGGSGGGTATSPNTSPSENYCAGNPVLISSGKKYQHSVDHTANFDMLNLERFYSQTNISKGMLGNKWKLNFEHSIEVSTDSNGDYNLATLNMPDGNNTNLFFNKETQKWFYMDGQHALLVLNKTDDSWVFQDINGITTNYNSKGLITSRFNLHQEGIVFVYENEQLEKVVSTTGDALYLSYNDAGLVNNIEIDSVIYSFTYTADDLLERVTLPNLSTYNFEYSDDKHFGALTAKKINGNLYARWAYNEDGRAVLSEHANGADRTEFSYNDNATTITNSLGKETTYNFTTINGKRVPTKVEGHESGTCIAANKSYTYDNFGNKDIVTDWQGNITDYDINQRGLLIRETRMANTENEQKVEYEWHSQLPLLLRKATRNLVTVYNYDTSNRLIERKTTSRATGIERIWSYQYELYDNGVVKNKHSFSPLGLEDIKTFDPKGNLLTSSNALGHSITYTGYDSLGNPSNQTDMNGIKTKFKYDKMGHLVETQELSGGKKATRFQYNTLGQIIEVDSSATGKTSYQYDDAYRKVGISNALGDSVNFTLNAAGNITDRVISEDNNPWTFADCNISSEHPDCSQGSAELIETLYPSTIGKTYDAQSRVTSVSRGGENVSTYQYDANNNIIKAIDGNGNATDYTYDPLNRKISETDENGNKTKYEYNNQNLITVLTDVRGNKTRYTYNDFGQLTQIFSPDSGISTFIYNEAGQKISSIRADGTELTYEYDVLNRLIATFSQGDVLLQNTYDNCKNGVGRICSVSDSSGTTIYSYHKTGQLKKKKVEISDESYDLKYKYDDAGRTKTIQYPSGMKVKYNFDKLGNIIAIKAKGKQLLNNVKYKPFGPIKSWTFGNSQKRVIQYDHQLKIQRILSTNVQDLRYQYDLSGNITSLYNSMYGLHNDFGYDELNRLTEIAGHDVESYEYDNLGNRISKEGSFTSSQYHTERESNKLISVDNENETRFFSYDDNGNVISDESITSSKQFIYNSQNRMSAATVNGKITTYAYNGDGKRVRKTLVNGTQYHYIYGAAGELLAESRNGKVAKEYIYLKGQLVGLVQDKSIYYVHTDHLGRPEIVTDKFQRTVWQAKNNAFGREVTIDNINGLNIGFPGQYWDQEKYSWYNGFRDYDSTIGRYLQSDPIGVNGGLNTYNYVLGNPLILTDLLGLAPVGGWPPSGRDPVDEASGGNDCITLNSPVGNATVSSEFNSTRTCTNCSTIHGGTDYAVPVGTAVAVTASGQVIRSYLSSTFGNVVIVDHGAAADGNGNVYTLYAHGDSRPVTEGQNIIVGSTVLISGNTGNSTGPHLHYEVIQTTSSPFTGSFFGNIDERHAPSDLNGLLTPP